MYDIIAGALLTVVVHSGNNLSTLASSHGGSWQASCQASKLANCNEIYPGQRLVIVRGSADRGALAYAASHTPALRADNRVRRAQRHPEHRASLHSAGHHPRTGYPPGSFQACVIARESGGIATAVNSKSGAGGLYGFLPSTWQSLGYSGLPENAPVSVQNQAFQREYSLAGTSPWGPYDGC